MVPVGGLIKLLNLASVLIVLFKLLKRYICGIFLQNLFLDTFKQSMFHLFKSYKFNFDKGKFNFFNLNILNF